MAFVKTLLVLALCLNFADAIFQGPPKGKHGKGAIRARGKAVPVLKKAKDVAQPKSLATKAKVEQESLF